MSAPINVILKSGAEVSLEVWQKEYGLDVGSDQLGKYFNATESRFAKDIQEFGFLYVNELLMRVMDAFRETVRQPVRINSFNRSAQKQAELKTAGYKTATHSPHMVFMAADIDTNSYEQTRAWAMVVQRVAIDLNIKVRIGYKQYIEAEQTFIHVDVCPEYYAPGKPFHNRPHPAAWEQVKNW